MYDINCHCHYYWFPKLYTFVGVYCSGQPSPHIAGLCCYRNWLIAVHTLIANTLSCIRDYVFTLPRNIDVVITYVATGDSALIYTHNSNNSVQCRSVSFWIYRQLASNLYSLSLRWSRLSSPVLALRLKSLSKRYRLGYRYTRKALSGGGLTNLRQNPRGTFTTLVLLFAATNFSEF